MFLLTVLVSSIYAGQQPVPSYYYPGFEATIENNLAFGGKPVSLLSGVESFNRTDLSIGTLYPISLSRRYNSRTSYDSPIGYGWAFGFDKRIYTYPDGSVTLRHENGWKKRFTQSGGNYISPLGDTGTLVQNTNGTFTYTYKSGDKENFDTFGRLSSMVDSKGNSLFIYYEYDTRTPLVGLLPANIDQTTAKIIAYDYRVSRIEEKDAAGNFTNKYIMFHYDSSTGRLSDIVDTAGRTVTYTHDSIGNLTGVTSPSGSVTYGYTDTNNKHRITSMNEGNGEYVNTYDTNGRVTKQTHGTGQVDFVYNVPYKKTTMTTTIKDSAGTVLNTQTRTTEFDDNGQLNKVTDTFGNVTTFIRDSNMWITREEYYENIGTVSSPTTTLRNAITFTYDTRGNTLTRTDAPGTSIEKAVTYTYDPNFSKVLTETVKSVVDPAQNKVITNTYDTNGNLLTTTETGLLGNATTFSYTTTFTYDSNGRIKTIDGPRTDVSDITTYSYDSATGNLLSVAQPLIGTTTYSNHDQLGNPQTITDPNGNATTYTYDTNGRVLTVKAAGDTAATQYFYVSGSGGCSSCGGSGSTDKIDHIILPEGNTIYYTYDTLGNLITIKDNQNNTINYTYDSAGNRLKEEIKDASNTLQKTLSYQYDALNRLSKVTNPDSTYTQYGYDYHGNRISAKDPKTNTTTYAYDALNRLITVIQPGTVTTAYTYDTSSNLASVKDANNNTTTYKYDDKGRVYQTISPDTGTTTYTYDPAGNMTSKKDATNTTITYQYDAVNRLTKIDFPTDTDIVYIYDSCLNGKGLLCSMTDSLGTTAYEYTPKGQLRKETKVIDGVTYVIQYSYDMNRNLKTMTYPSGRVITYNYANDKAVSVLNNAANLATNINYKPFGGLSSITYGNGIIGTVNYDNQYRISSITASPVMSLNYSSYDSNGNITAINNTLDVAKNKSFSYDSLDRLSTAAAPGIWGTLTWTYDGVGNRQMENLNSYTYRTGTNKLSSANGKAYNYDNNGNTTEESSRVFVYNDNQRLVRVVDAGVTKGEYTYNANAQRVKKIVNGKTTVFHYDLRGQLIAESDNTGATTAEYVYLNSKPLAKIDLSGTNYIHNDHLGTPVAMTAATRAKVWEITTKPFGNGATITGTANLNLRFPGQYFDAETGMNYNYYRDYNPEIGRYLQSDLSGINKGFNHLYAFVGNNPVIFIDIFGLSCEVASSSTINWQDVKEITFYGNWIYTGYSRINMLCWCNFHRAKRIDVTLTDNYKTINLLFCREKDKCGKEITYFKTEESTTSFTVEYSKYGGTEYKEEKGSMFATPGKEKSGGGCSCQPIFPPPPGIYSK